jgi:hypothetical protein
MPFSVTTFRSGARWNEQESLRAASEKEILEAERSLSSERTRGKRTGRYRIFVHAVEKQNDLRSVDHKRHRS